MEDYQPDQAEGCLLAQVAVPQRVREGACPLVLKGACLPDPEAVCPRDVEEACLPDPEADYPRDPEADYPQAQEADYRAVPEEACPPAQRPITEIFLPGPYLYAN